MEVVGGEERGIRGELWGDSSLDVGDHATCADDGLLLYLGVLPAHRGHHVAQCGRHVRDDAQVWCRGDDDSGARLAQVSHRVMELSRTDMCGDVLVRSFAPITTTAMSTPPAAAART